MADIRQAAERAKMGKNDVDVKSSKYVPPHRRGITIDDRKAKPKGDKPPSASVETASTLPTIVLPPQVDQLPELETVTFAKNPQMGILDIAEQNGYHSGFKNRLSQQLSLKGEAVSAQMNVAGALKDVTTLLTGLTVDASSMIRLAASPIPVITKLGEKASKFNGKIVIIQPAIGIVTNNVAAYEKVRSSVNGLEIQLVNTDDSKLPPKACYSGHLLAQWMAMPDQKTSALWLDSNDWKFPTDFFYPNSSCHETFVDIITETTFPTVVVVQRNRWLDDPAPISFQKQKTVGDVLYASHHIYAGADTERDGKMATFILIRK